MDPPDPKELRDQLEPRVLVELLVLLELWVFMEKEVRGGEANHWPQLIKKHCKNNL